MLLAAAAASLLPLRSRPVGRPELTAILLVVGYLLFYARVDTLADWAERYFYPTSVLLYFLALPVFVFALRTLATWPALAPVRIAIGFFLMSALFFRIHNGIEGYGSLLKAGVVSGPEDRNLVLGHKLAKIKGIRDMSIASVDAGAVPFATMSYHIDMVGLNTRYIAEHPDVTSAAAYLFDQRPTIILYRTLQSGEYVTTGHGPLGDERTWAANPGWDEYAYAGTFDESDVYCMNFFVRRDAPQFDQLMQALRTTVADRVAAAPPVKLGREAAQVPATQFPPETTHTAPVRN